MSVALLILTLIVVFGCGSSTPAVVTPRPTSTATPAATEPGSTPGPTDTPSGSPSDTPGPTEPTLPPTETPLATPSPTPPPASAVEMPFVPVVSFWSTRESIPMAELSSAATAGNVRVTADDAAALGWSVPASALVGTADEVRVAVREPGVMGLLRATDVDQSVHALGIDNANLFGNDRVATNAEWPLLATVQSSETWDQSASWTLVAAGDIMLDRGVAQQTTILGKGADYLFDGGTARVTRVRCCSFYNYPYPDVERTGNGGVVRDLLTGADITMANLETAVLENAPFHDAGFTFTSDASLLPAFVDAGFDMLSLANNHSRDAGERGLTCSRRPSSRPTARRSRSSPVTGCAARALFSRLPIASSR